MLRLIDGRDLRGRCHAEALDIRTFPAGSKSRAGNADRGIERRLVCHLSNTASVDAHFILGDEMYIVQVDSREACIKDQTRQANWPGITRRT